MKQIICIRLVQWPIDRRRRSRLRDKSVKSESTTAVIGTALSDRRDSSPVNRLVETPASFDIKKNARKNRKTKAATSSPYPFPVDHSKPMRHDLWFGRGAPKHESCDLEKVSGFQTANASPFRRNSKDSASSASGDISVLPAAALPRERGENLQNSAANLHSDFAIQIPELPAPLVIVRTVADRQVIVSLSPESLALGIRPGMTLTQARALCAHVEHAEHEPLRDSRAMEAFARWLMRFSPVVSLAGHDFARKETASKSKSAGALPTPQGIFLDLTGCDRLFGGLTNLVSQIHQAISRLRIAARFAVAPTPGAAWALAEAGKNGTIVSDEDLATAISPLPPAALRLSADLVAALHHLGLSTISHVMNLPRNVLPARFGKELLFRLDQALGNIAEPLVPLEHHAPVEAKMDFDGPVSSLEAIHAVARQLLQDVIAQLAHRGCGARRIDLELSRAYALPVKKTIQLSHPSRDIRSLFNLMICALEEGGGDDAETRRRDAGRGLGAAEKGRLGDTGTRRHGDAERNAKFAFPTTSPLRVSTSPRPRVSPPSASPYPRVPAPPRPGVSPPSPPRVSPRVPASPCHRVSHSSPSSVSLHGDGYIAIHLRVPLLQRLSEEQIFLLEQEQHAGRLEVDRLVDRLRLRLGEASALRVELVESHLPEKAWKIQVQNAEGGVRNEPIKSISSTLHSSFCTLHLLNRPLHLLTCPAELRVMVTPSNAIEGRPAAFVHEHQVHKIVHCAGPERIAGVWWEGRDKTRDYYEIENAAGRKFWIFRVAETARWYLHGRYE